MEQAGERAIDQTVVIPLAEVGTVYGYNPETLPKGFGVDAGTTYSFVERRLVGQKRGD